MRDFVRDSWRIAAACAAGAFVLSLVIGLVSGNPFGVAFSRALLLALLFAGLGVVLRAVVKAYLPEMIATAPPAATQGTEARAGAVDIVVPEDETLQRQAFQRPADGAPPAEAAGSEDEEPEEVLEAPEDDETSAEARALGALAEELGEPGALEEEGGSGGSRSRGTAGGRKSPAGPPVEAAEVSFRGAPGELPAGDVEPAELDALPDLGELEPPPPRKNGPAPRVPRAAAGETPEDAARSLMSSQDPVTLARAIRTALKKDEKG